VEEGKKIHPESQKKENILDIMAEIDAVGNGDKSNLQARVENMERQIVEGSGSKQPMIEPLSLEDIAEEQASERELQVQAAARGERVQQKGAPPRINNFFIVRSTMEPRDFVDFVDREVLNKNEIKEEPCGAMMGMVTLRFMSGQPRPGSALPADPQGPGTNPLAKVEPMIITKLDAGPWPWYDRASTDILTQIVERMNCRAWVCGWALDKEWSWVEAWRPHRRTGLATMTETIDGPSNGEVTRRAAERWGVSARDAFDTLHLAVQFECLRRWLILPEPRPLPYTSHVSHLAGKLLIQRGDEEWIPRKWAENFPGRKPEDGPLHLQRYYLPRGRSLGPELDSPEKRKALSFRTEPPSLGL